MPNVSDPTMRAVSWVPNTHPDFMQGENRLDGKVIAIRGWGMRSDRAKLRALRELALRYGGDPHMRWFTVNNILKPAGVEQRDYKAQAAAMLRWVQSNIYYTNEPDEQVQSPWRTIKVLTGDCDDSSLLLASFAESIKMPWRFVLAGKDRSGLMVRWVEGTKAPYFWRRVQFAHIYCAMGWPPFAPKEWASAEPTVRGAPLGYDVVEHGVQRWNEVAGSGLPSGGGRAPQGQTATVTATVGPTSGRSTPTPSGKPAAPRPSPAPAPVSMGPGMLRGHTTAGFGGLGVLPVLADHKDDIIVGVAVGIVTLLGGEIIREAIRRKR